MTTTTTTQRDEVYDSLLHDLTAIVPITAGAPNILGRVYGARMCDKAINVSRAVDRLIIGLEDGLTDILWRTVERTCHDHGYRNSRTRDSLRAAAGEPPITEDEIQRTLRRERMPPLSASEHVAFSACLKVIRTAMIRAEIDIRNAGGPRRDDLLTRVRKVTRFLETLRSHMALPFSASAPAASAAIGRTISTSALPPRLRRGWSTPTYAPLRRIIKIPLCHASQLKRGVSPHGYGAVASKTGWSA
jgi:hypothetical protein